MSFAEYVGALRKDGCSIRLNCGCSLKRPVEDLFLSVTESEEARLLCDACCDPVIDTYFCPTCLNSTFSTVAINNKHRCTNCLKCPRCFSLLSNVVGGDGKVSLECPACQWDSKTIGLCEEDMKAVYAKVRAHEANEPAATMFTQLQDMFGKQHAKTMKVEEEGEWRVGEEQHAMGVDELRDNAAAVKRIETSLTNITESLWRLPKEPVKYDSTKDEARSVVDPKLVCSTKQRNAHPGNSPFTTSEAWPYFALLSAKLAYRDPFNSKFVLKPQAGAGKVSFEKNEAALSYLPKVMLKEVPNLAANEAAPLRLVFVNSLSVPIKLKLETTDSFLTRTAEAEAADEVGMEDEVKPSITKQADTATVTFGQPEFQVEAAAPPAKDGEEKEAKSEVEMTVTPNEGQDVKFSFVVTLVPEEGESPPGFAHVSYQMFVSLGSLA